MPQDSTNCSEPVPQDSYIHCSRSVPQDSTNCSRSVSRDSYIHCSRSVPQDSTNCSRSVSRDSYKLQQVSATIQHKLQQVSVTGQLQTAAGQCHKTAQTAAGQCHKIAQTAAGQCHRTATNCSRSVPQDGYKLQHCQCACISSNRVDSCNMAYIRHVTESIFSESIQFGFQKNELIQLITPHLFSVFRHLRQWRGGGGGGWYDPPWRSAPDGRRASRKKTVDASR